MEQLENFRPSQSASKSWAKRETQETETVTERSVFYDQLRQPGATARFLTLEYRSQEQYAIATREIDEIYFHPERGIFLFYRNGRIHIEGRNLSPLLSALTQQRVTTLRDYSRKAEMLFDEKALVITAIHFESEQTEAL